MKKSSCSRFARTIGSALCVIACAAFFTSCTNFLDSQKR